MAALTGVAYRVGRSGTPTIDRDRGRASAPRPKTPAPWPPKPDSVPHRARVAAIMVVRNEEAILLDSVGHLLRNLNVDRLHVSDNGSDDRTPALLDRIARFDPRVTWRSDPGPFAQDIIATRLARDAWEEGADWILPSDADEFLDPGPGGFAPLDTAGDVGAMTIPVQNFVQCRWIRSLLAATPARTRARTIDSMVFSVRHRGSYEDGQEPVRSGGLPFVRMTYPAKHLFRASRSLVLDRGCHGALGVAGAIGTLPGSAFLHAPIRTPQDMGRRVTHARRMAELVPDPEVGWHLRRLLPFSQAELDADWRLNSTRFGRIGGPGRGLRIDLRLLRISRGLAAFRRDVMAGEPAS